MDLYGTHNPDDPNSGHGHVHPRPDGAVARCGGPALCGQCRAEKEQQGRESFKRCPRCNSDTCPGRDTFGEDCTLLSVEDFVTQPVVAYPRDWEGTDAEAVGVAVAGALVGVEKERDQARDDLTQTRQELVMTLTALEALVEAFPETSWAADSKAKDDAQALLDRLAPKPPT